MSGQPVQPSLSVDIHESSDPQGGLMFTFVLVEPTRGRNSGGPPRRLPQFVVLVRGSGPNIAFDWSQTPDDPGAARPELEREATERVDTRVAWIALVSDLVGQVEQWGRELGWATRRIEKQLDDSQIGKHRVPGLLMQEDTCRILLEPVGRSAPGAEGVVDLYLMPGYDDIASLYYYDGRWNLHYAFPGSEPAASVREAEAMPLSKEAMRRVLAELRQNAV